MSDSLSSRIAEDLAALGVRKGDVLLVHSSLKSLGVRECTPAVVIEGLLRALGEDGTLLMPALSYATVGPGPAQTTTFDVLLTPSCVGTIPEAFRLAPGVLRSVHPTHSACALGRRAEELTADHHLDTTPCGEHSPFARLPRVGGKVLMLGCGLSPNTSMHAVEEAVRPPYLFGEPATYRIILADRREIAMTVLRHNFAGCRQRYDRVGPLLAPEANRTGKVLAADCHLLDARALWSAGVEAMRKNPAFFVEPVSSPLAGF